jgi:hypothetical protein
MKGFVRVFGGKSSMKSRAYERKANANQHGLSY